VSLRKPNRPDASDARDIALKLLGRREHSREELLRKLAARDFAAADIVTLLDKLEAERWLSDARFTESYIHARQARGFGPVRIRMELRERGVANAIIDERLNAVAGLWADLLYTQYRKRYGATPANDYKERASRARFLQQRGFESEMIWRLLDELKEAP
jgi:regulatory protein